MMKRVKLAGLLFALGASFCGSASGQGGGPANTIVFGQGPARSFGFAGPCAAGVPLIGNGAGSAPSCATMVNQGTTAAWNIASTANSLVQGIHSVSSSPTSGNPNGPLNFNEIQVNNQSGVTNTGVTEPNTSFFAAGLRVQMTIGGANLKGFQASGFFKLDHTIANSNPGTADYIAVASTAHSNKDGGTAGLYGGDFVAWTTSGAVHTTTVGTEIENHMDTGSTVTNQIGLRVNNNSAVAPSALSHAITIKAVNASTGWNKLISFNQEGDAQSLRTNGDFFYHPGSMTVANIFNLSGVTVTGNYFNFPNLTWSPTTMNWTINSTGNHAVWANSNTGGIASITLENDQTSNAIMDVGMRGSARAAFGALVANDAYAFANHANGMILMASNASGPIRFSPGGNTERARFTPSGGLDVGATTDMPAGVINANTGYRVANAATSGNVMRGNGTNFVSAQLNLTDVATTWAAYTPTLSCGSGSLTTASATGRHLTYNNVVHVQIQVTITTGGTCVGLKASLPSTAAQAAGFGGASTAPFTVGGVVTASSSDMQIWKQNGTIPDNGSTSYLGGTYEK